MKTLIVYYSLEGNTEYAVGRISEATGADVLRIVPKKAYKDRGLGKFLSGGRSAVMAEAPDLQPYDARLDEYDRIIFGTPVWASSFAPPLRTFILENSDDLEGKHFAAFACQSGSGAEKALAKLKTLIGTGAFEAEAVFTDPKSRPSESAERAIDGFIARLTGRE